MKLSSCANDINVEIKRWGEGEKEGRRDREREGGVKERIFAK